MKLGSVFGVSLLIGAGACANAALVEDFDADVSGDGGSSSDCPQFDLMKDPKHCGSCTKACAADQVCAAGECKSQCDPPTTKCLAEGGVICADLKNDIQHCGSCTKVCPSADAGAMPPGPNNPDGSLPFDGGPGWSVGTPSCAMGMCGTACAGGMTACADGLCYDLQNHHDHCGDCNTACAMDTEWCNFGHCCALDKMYCNGMCVDVRSDKDNCGTCGNKCSGNTPNCYNGKCSATCTPSGQRQPYNTLSSKTTTGCWNGNPCAQGTYNWVTQNGQSFINVNEEIVCGGTTACVDHIGVTTYEQASNCQGSWDVYCDGTKVGTIDTTNKACQGNAMNNGCSISFQPATCMTIKLIGKTGSVGACCGSTGLHSMITGVSAW